MNILLATSAAPAVSPFSTREKSPPLGVGSLISILRNRGHNVFFIDNYLKPQSSREHRFIQSKKIDIVGIYANTICFADTLRMLDVIQKQRENKKWSGKIMVGGPHTSVAVDSIPEYVDYVVQGEGEQAVIDIAEGNANQRLIRNPRLENLDGLPFQPWDIFAEMDYDFSCQWLDSKRVFTMNTSRGCPFNCSFCSVGSIWGKRYSCFSAERIVAEIEYLIKHHSAEAIYFREDNFTLNKNRVVEFCRLINTRKLNIQWACETRVNTLCDNELVELMSRNGCRAVYLGVESGSQKMLDILQKQITVEQIEKCIRLCHKYGIRTYCSLITGVPGERYKDYLATKRLIGRLKPYSHAFNVFVGIPDSKLYRKVIDEGLYECIDDVGIAYLPGYDVRTNFFYGKKSRVFVDHKFKERTKFDRELLKRMPVKIAKLAAGRITKKLLPAEVVSFIKRRAGCL